jgi:hypothetical protein
MSANGSSGGSGNGGPITFGGTSTTIPTTLKSTLTANGGGSGTGNGGTITLSPTSNVTLGSNAGEFLLSATGGSTSGNGGTITVQPFSGNITVDDTATPISVAVPGTTGNGGTITLSSTNLTFNGTASQLTANGGTTSGNGGTISLTASGSVLTIGTGSTGNVQLYAKAPGNGNGGTINVTDYAGITVNSADLSVLAGTAGNGNGGTIALTGGPATLTGSFNANGAGNGNGGTINFQVGYFTFNGTQSFTANSLGTGKGGNITLNSTYSGQTSTLTLGANTTLQATSTSGNGGTINITAASQPIAITGDGITVTAGGNGNGGTITINATDNSLILNGILSANGTGSGNGGNITLNTPAAYPIDLTSLSITTEGGDTGGGGNVTISNADEFDWNADVDVNPYDENVPAIARPIAPSTTGSKVSFKPAVITFQAVPGGTKTSHGITCQQFLVSGTTWPTAYWNCVHPTNQGTDTYPVLMAATLPNSIQTAFLQAPQVVLMVQTDADAFATFWSIKTGIPGGLGNGGWTLPSFSTGGPVASTPFENANNYAGVYTNFNQTQIQEATAHELGHAEDDISGMLSGTTPYKIYISNDYAYLMNAGAPCTAAGTGPFNNVIDSSTNAQFCNGGTLVNGQAGGKYAGLNNVQIANASLPGFFPPLPGPYPEIFAESFAYQSWLVPQKINSYFVQTMDGLVHNGYFACAQYEASQLLGGNLPPPSYCNN